MSAATDLVGRQIAACRARDTDAFLACYAKDVKIRDFDGNVMADGLEGPCANSTGRYSATARSSACRFCTASP